MRIVKTLSARNPHWYHGFDFTLQVIAAGDQFHFIMAFNRTRHVVAAPYSHIDDELFDSVESCILGAATYYASPSCDSIRRNEITAFFRTQRKAILDTQLSLF